MRLDKFLKVSRVIKRRTVANEAADSGRVSVNGKVVKPSYEVKVGDVVEIKFGDKVSKFEIVEIPKVQGKNMGELIKILQKRKERLNVSIMLIIVPLMDLGSFFEYNRRFFLVNVCNAYKIAASGVFDNESEE